MYLFYLKANISEIVSDNFVNTVSEYSKQSNDENIKSYSLELLLNVAQNGGVEIENEVKSTIGNLKLLELIGDSDSTLNEQILQIVMKWYNNEQLQQVKKAFDKLQKYCLTIETKKKDLLSDELIPTILTLFNQANEQLLQSQLNNKEVSSLIIGMINCCCYSLIQIVNNKSEIAFEFIKAGFLTQFEKFFINLPLQQAKTLHFKQLESVVKLTTVKNHHFLFKIGVFQSISKFLFHTSLTLIESISESLYQIIQSGLIHASTNSNSEISFPTNSIHPYFDILKNDGTLNILENIIISNKFDTKINGIIIKMLILLYRGFPIPSSLLDIVLNWLSDQLEGNLNDNNNNPQLKNEILIALRIIYQQGEAKTKEQIKQQAPLEWIESLINRQNLVHQFYAFGGNEQILRQSNAIKDDVLNRQIFALMIWYQDEEKMDQILKYQNEIENILRNDCMNEDIQNDNQKDQGIQLEKKEINIWECI